MLVLSEKRIGWLPPHRSPLLPLRLLRGRYLYWPSPLETGCETSVLSSTEHVAYSSRKSGPHYQQSCLSLQVAYISGICPLSWITWIELSDRDRWPGSSYLFMNSVILGSELVTMSWVTGLSVIQTQRGDPHPDARVRGWSPRMKVLRSILGGLWHIVREASQA